jgi:hypothetical protein
VKQILGGQSLKRTLIIAALLTGTLSAWGQTSSQSILNFDSTGNDLVASCHVRKEHSTLEDVQDRASCAGFIHGAIQGFAQGASMNKKTQSVVLPCIPPGVTNGQLIKVIVAYTDKHPSDLHYGASVLVWWALVDAWGLDTPEHACQ